MGTIFIVRHGEDEDNAQFILNGRRDKPLTELGKEQAKAVGQKLKSHNIDVIYSSPLKRAYQTAEIIAKELGIDEVIRNENLVERDFGILTGKTIIDIPRYAKKLFQGDKISYFLEADEAEGFPATYKRAQEVLEVVKKEHSNENVLLVSHGDMSMMLRAVYLEWTWQKGLEAPYIANTEIVELASREDNSE